MKAAMMSMPDEAKRMVLLQRRLETGLKVGRGDVIFADSVPRLPNTTLVTAPE